MKYDHFDTIFLIEFERYEQAANFMLRDMFGEKIYDMGKREITLKRKKIAKELERRFNLVRKKYPHVIGIEQMRQIAREVYDQAFQALV